MKDLKLDKFDRFVLAYLDEASSRGRTMEEVGEAHQAEFGRIHRFAGERPWETKLTAMYVHEFVDSARDDDGVERWFITDRGKDMLGRRDEV